MVPPAMNDSHAAVALLEALTDKNLETFTRFQNTQAVKVQVTLYCETP